VTILASFFLLIERMAVHLQDPFENRPTDTPMLSISRGIERNLRQMLNENDEEIPEKYREEKYYVM
jgi:ion channel-forming bestrophin family protein